MSVHFACPKCSREWDVSDVDPGKTRALFCPGCGMAVPTDRAGLEAFYAPPEASIVPPRPEMETLWDRSKWRVGIMIKRGPAGDVRGWTKGQLSKGGFLLYLPLTRKYTRIVRGDEVRYLGGKKFEATLNGQKITLAVMENGMYEARLASDIVDYLKGNREEPAPSNYRISRALLTLYLVPLLVLSLGTTSMPWKDGREVWLFIVGAVVITLLAFTGAIIKFERWAQITRFLVCLVLDIVGILAFVQFGRAIFRALMTFA